MEKIKIALAMDGKGNKAKVAEWFGRAKCLLLVESDTGAVQGTFDREAKGDVDLARRIADWGCECVLCGPLEEAPFLILADEAGVTRYDAAGLDASTALRRFNEDSLPLIRDFIGGKGCQSSGAGECHEH